MINVNIRESVLGKLKDNNYILEHRSKQLSIRGFFGEPLCEMIYLEETNEILVMTETTFKYGKKVESIEFDINQGFIVFLSSEIGKKMEKIKVTEK